MYGYSNTPFNLTYTSTTKMTLSILWILCVWILVWPWNQSLSFFNSNYFIIKDESWIYKPPNELQTHVYGFDEYVGIKIILKPLFLDLKLPNLQGLINLMCMGIYVSLKSYMSIYNQNDLKFFMDLTCVNMNMTLL